MRKHWVGWQNQCHQGAHLAGNISKYTRFLWKKSAKKSVELKNMDDALRREAHVSRMTASENHPTWAKRTWSGHSGQAWSSLIRQILTQKKRKNLHISASKQPNLVTPSKFFRSVSCSACNRRDHLCFRSGWVISQRLWNLKKPAMSPITCQLLISSRSQTQPFSEVCFSWPVNSKLPKKSHTFSGWNRGNIAALKRFFQGHNVSQRLWNLKAPAMSPITCPLLVSSRSLHGPTDSNLPNKSHTFSGWNWGNIAALKRFFQGHNVSQRLWNLKAPAMSPITCPLLVSSRSLHGPTDSNLPNKSYTFSGWTGETSQLWRISRFFQGRNISLENRTSGDVGSLVKVPKAMVKDFYQ